MDVEVDYATTRGAPLRPPSAEAPAHLFNHQTYYRGQAHAILTRLGVADPLLFDLMIMQRERAYPDTMEAAG